MPTFTYRAKKGPSELVEGVVEAPTKAQAIRQIAQLGFFPLDVTESKVSHPKEKEIVQKGSALSFARIRPKNITFLTTQLATLLRAQVPILRALALLKDQTSNPKVKELLESLYQDVKDGKSLSIALHKFSKSFPPSYIALVQSGEMSGKLDEILERLARFLEEEEEFRRQIQGALAYPAFLLIVGILTVWTLLTFVLPRLTILFHQMKVELPLVTRVLIRVSEFMAHSWIYWIGTFAALFLIYFSAKKVQRLCKRFGDRLRMRLPVLGGLVRSAEIERFSRTLGLLLKSGLPLVPALGASVEVIDNEEIRKEFQGVQKDLLGGAPLSRALSGIRVLPAYVRDMLAIGEESGRLEQVLEDVANNYSREISRYTKIMSTLLEPLMILFLGLVVGLIVAATLLPVFQLNMAV